MSEKRYWRTLEEMEGHEIASHGEFFSTPLREGETAGLPRLDDPGRRDFLKLMGASFAMMGLAACTRRPVEKIVPYLKRPEDVLPGIANFYASTCRECNASCGVLIKSREGRPIKFEGNEKHPVSKGAICARGQASVLSLYDPDRRQTALRPARKGLDTPVKWEALDVEVTAKLAQVRGNGGRVRVLTGELSGLSTPRVIRDFLAGFANGKHVAFEPLGTEEIASASEASYGQRQVPQLHFEKADVIVSFGADFLGTWRSAIEFSRGFAKNRKPEHGKMSRFLAFEPIATVTGTNADERYRVKSGDEYKAALALACELIVNQKRSALASDSGVQSVLSAYAPSLISSQLGIPADVFKKVAQELWNARGKSLVLGGGNTAKGDHGFYLELAVNLLNSALENEGATVDGTRDVANDVSSYRGLVQLIQDMKAGTVDALFIYKVNPEYVFPPELGFGEAMQKVGLVVSFDMYLNETARKADYLCTTPHATEDWGDANPSAGLFSVQQPTIAPLYQTRGFEDSLMAWAKQLKLEGAIATLPTWHAYLQNSWRETVYSQSKTTTPFPLFWDSVLREGFVDLRAKGTAPKVRKFNASSLAKLPKLEWTRGTTLVLYPKVGLYDGRQANVGWLQELPDPVSRIVWDNYLMVSPSRARVEGVKEGDVVKVTVGKVSAELPVHIQPGMHDHTFAAAVGYGRTYAGRVGNDVGVNVFPLAGAATFAMKLSALSTTIAKTGKNEDLANTQGHHALENRPIVREAAFKEYRHNPAAGNEDHEKLTSIWPKWEYKGYRWGMAIDLNSCTGCGACVVSCQAENNIPVVGKKYALSHKEMHWMRIDRYYSGDTDNPSVVYQPMLCQHCENAPCETVCPVLASVHSPEGLNEQVYNRCVGTRYCENNCPYKVRRFNWFGFTDVASPLNLVFNPDITVRTRGIMEKCTFCVQRLAAAKDKAKDEGRAVRDGEAKTACQQSCPTEAIIFGNMNDQGSTVAKVKADPRGYHVLEEINVRSSITYLTKIRNTET